jgi:hypothetical protein
MHPTSMAILAIEHQRQLRAEAEQNRRGRTGPPRASTLSMLEALLLRLRLPWHPRRTPGTHAIGRRHAAQPEPR